MPDFESIENGNQRGIHTERLILNILTKEKQAIIACFFFVVLQLIVSQYRKLFTIILFPEIMSQQTLSSDPFGSSTKAFFQSAAITAVLLALFFTLSGELNLNTIHLLILPFIFVPMAGGIAGLIFRNTSELREADGLKKVLGWTIGVLAYLILLPTSFILGLNGLN